MTAPTIILLVVLALMIGGGVGYYLNTRRQADRPQTSAKRLEEYSFYPFVVNQTGYVEFDATAFEEAVEHLLANENRRAAHELIVIGEQNLVRSTLGSETVERYRRLFVKYDGDAVLAENDAYLENYKRIVRLVGRSFPRIGFEILLHNLVNPTKSIVAIESGEVTGRTVEMGTTKLVLDLKTRSHLQQDKLNYELNIGSRRFKCTTIPILRDGYGLVGAICINIDSRFLREEVLPDPDRLRAFFDNFLRTDMELDENILSPAEYTAAMRGKRHFLDEAILPSTAPEERRLTVIAFSDIVGWTEMMRRDEGAALAIRNRNNAIHATALAAFHGRLLKDLGDGSLMSFNSVSDAAECAFQIREAVVQDGRYSVRIGVHLGEVTLSHGDVIGDGVNIASRIQSEAEPGGVVVSEAVFQNLRNKPGIKAVALGPRHLKNVAEPMPLYSIEAVVTT